MWMKRSPNVRGSLDVVGQTAGTDKHWILTHKDECIHTKACDELYLHSQVARIPLKSIIHYTISVRLIGLLIPRCTRLYGRYCMKRDVCLKSITTCRIPIYTLEKKWWEMPYLAYYLIRSHTALATLVILFNNRIVHSVQLIHKRAG